jgi:ABC-2 type transport system ATP-binding protein/lipopolysaccharide transport system ATP-binding protein
MPSLSLRNVSVDFPIYQANTRSLKKMLIAGTMMGNVARDAHQRVTVRALDNVSLDIEPGERVGIIGPNGAGKTTLLKVLAGIFKPTEGRAYLSGRTMALINASVGLNPNATGRENIILRGMYMDVHPREMRERIAAIAEFTELGPYLDMPVQTYSAGMTIRLAFAISTCVCPEILILDEWIASGDRAFLAKARRRMDQFVGGSSTVVLASHSPELVRRWCRRVIYLRGGAVRGVGAVDEMLAFQRADAARKQTAA